MESSKILQKQQEQIETLKAYLARCNSSEFENSLNDDFNVREHKLTHAFKINIFNFKLVKLIIFLFNKLFNKIFSFRKICNMLTKFLKRTNSIQLIAVLNLEAYQDSFLNFFA